MVQQGRRIECSGEVALRHRRRGRDRLHRRGGVLGSELPTDAREPDSRPPAGYRTWELASDLQSALAQRALPLDSPAAQLGALGVLHGWE
jgi:hypothetical protein